MITGRLRSPSRRFDYRVILIYFKGKDNIMESWRVVLVAFTIFSKSDGQFLYPVDPNPPRNPLTFTCYACTSESDSRCARPQTDSNRAEECTGIRIGCWTTVNLETGEYERGCTQPSTLRQGVFCNRHMEGREFCSYIETRNGFQRICSRCCLNDYCNREVLQGSPDPEFQTCFECDGRNEPECNVGRRDALKEHMVEQCLMPNSDCWTAKNFYNGELFYLRGCQISPCDDSNVEEVCTSTRNSTTCTKCCPGGQKCNYGLLSGDGYRTEYSIVQLAFVAMATILARLA